MFRVDRTDSPTPTPLSGRCVEFGLFGSLISPFELDSPFRSKFTDHPSVDWLLSLFASSLSDYIEIWNNKYFHFKIQDLLINKHL